MSRVFVSYATRDRAVGEELGTLVRALGHEPVDDQDDRHGTAWWNEVVGRIEGSDVFVAVASPAYAGAHACRLAAKHAAATGLPVVRVDLDTAPVADCHPVVAEARGVVFAPHDPDAVVRLARALTGEDDAADEAAAPPPEEPVPPAPPEVPDDRSPLGWGGPDDVTTRPLGEGGLRRPSRVELALAAVMVVVAALLVWVGVSNRSGPETSSGPTQTTPAVSEASASNDPAADDQATGAAVGDAVAAVLAQVQLVDSSRLPAASCQAGADAVTCTNPAPSISTVVLTPYASSSDLYAAYVAQVENLSGAPIVENAGNCSTTESEGEVGWNLDKEHTLEFSVADQAAGGLDAATESAGRVFCTASQQVMKLVWTQDPGLLVTVTGQPSDVVVTWWSQIHVELACAIEAVGTDCPAS